MAPDVELAFYRIGQEGLSNVARHAGAAHAGLNLLFGEEQHDPYHPRRWLWL